MSVCRPPSNTSSRIDSVDGEYGKMSGKIPRHVAIIMDGNGRWATRRKMPRMFGHQKGVLALKRAVEACLEQRVDFLTVYAFSTENWRRSEMEVNGLMSLLKKTLKSELADLHKQGIRLKTIGRRDRLPKDLIALIDNAVKVTADNTKMTLVMALDYGGRDEIVSATRFLAQSVKEGSLDPEDITDEIFSKALYTADIPDPDLFIRTSDVVRLSNFLIWQTTYTELFFLKKCWPDFQKEDLCEAIRQFQGCERRFGRASLSE
tara:strand:+ start:1106 stop:1891 length:786 start_codon:yes stop_codon:yes gene_type:complete